jgi:hypothetical protein
MMSGEKARTLSPELDRRLYVHIDESTLSCILDGSPPALSVSRYYCLPPVVHSTISLQPALTGNRRRCRKGLPWHGDNRLSSCGNTGRWCDSNGQHGTSNACAHVGHHTP